MFPQRGPFGERSPRGNKTPRHSSTADEIPWLETMARNAECRRIRIPATGRRGRYGPKRRVVVMIPVAFLASVILFMLLKLTPGDPVLIILGERATAEN